MGKLVYGSGEVGVNYSRILQVVGRRNSYIKRRTGSTA